MFAKQDINLCKKKIGICSGEGVSPSNPKISTAALSETRTNSDSISIKASLDASINSLVGRADEPFRKADWAQNVMKERRNRALLSTLGGCLRLQRSDLESLLRKYNLWKALEDATKRLNADMVVIPIINESALSNLMSNAAMTLTRQLKLSILKELDFEKQGYVPPQKPIVSWDRNDIEMFLDACGASMNAVRCLDVSAVDLHSMKSDNEFAELLPQSSELVLQRVKFQLEMFRSEQVEIQGTKVIHEKKAATQGGGKRQAHRQAWWKNPVFGVKARKPLLEWTVDDVLQFCAELQLPKETAEKIKLFALDGAGMAELRREDAHGELGLQGSHLDVFMASIVLLKRPPEKGSRRRVCCSPSGCFG